MFIERDIEGLIRSGAQQSPVIAIIGPRQSGKSTLIKKMFPDYTYLDMQDADLFDFATQDPKGFLETYKDKVGVIIDEAQYAPQLFSQLKVEVDKDPRPGYYVLSGSQNFLLHEKISESLAGRVYFYPLLPLSVHELKRAGLVAERAEDQIVKGFYPRVYQPNIKFHDYYSNYISTYVERDIRRVRNIDNILVFKKFMQLCALSVGTTLNVAELAMKCGISVPTAKSWLALLEASFIIFLLPSYHNNLGKRVIKSPKLYFYDVGLALELMGIEQDAFNQQRTIYGALFENMITVDLIKYAHAYGYRLLLTFFRDTNQNEIDLIIEMGQTKIPVEIKASETMDARFFDTIAWFNEHTKNEHEGMVVYGGKQNQKRSQGKVVSWKNIETIIAEK